jgi:hypothetical protein
MELTPVHLTEPLLEVDMVELEQETLNMEATAVQVVEHMDLALLEALELTAKATTEDTVLTTADTLTTPVVVEVPELLEKQTT